MHLRMTAIGLLALALTSAGCAATEEPETGPAYDVVSSATLVAGDSIPVPTGDVVLRLTGDISATNVGDALELDMATLERIGVVTYAVDDQQAEGRVAEFSGVLLDQLLAVAGADASATLLATRAVNDYEVEIPIADVDAYPVLVATTVDGDRMGVDRFGPLRVVYPYHAFDLAPATYDPRWIWQLVSIDVR